MLTVGMLLSDVCIGLDDVTGNMSAYIDLGMGTESEGSSRVLQEMGGYRSSCGDFVISGCTHCSFNGFTRFDRIL